MRVTHGTRRTHAMIAIYGGFKRFREIRTTRPTLTTMHMRLQHQHMIHGGEGGCGHYATVDSQKQTEPMHKSPCALHDETEMQKHRQAAHRARPIRAMHPPTAGKHAASSRAPSTGRCRPIACALAGHESPAWPAALAAAHQDEKARRSHKPSLDSMPVLPSLSATARMRHGSVSMGTADVAVRARLESSPVMRQTTDQ